jgi:predicted transcriptional regulator
MAKIPKDVTDAELAVLRDLWERSPATIRDLTDRLYPGGATSHYATVQKLLERLEEKRFVTRDASAVPHRFGARVDQSELIGRRLREMADQLCGGAVGPLLTHLVQSQPLSKSDIGQLRDLIDRLDRKANKKKG